jgi:hypothetical protein
MKLEKTAQSVKTYKKNYGNTGTKKIPRKAFIPSNVEGLCENIFTCILGRYINTFKSRNV